MFCLALVSILWTNRAFSSRPYSQGRPIHCKLLVVLYPILVHFSFCNDTLLCNQLMMFVVACTCTCVWMCIFKGCDNFCGLSFNLVHRCSPGNTAQLRMRQRLMSTLCLTPVCQYPPSAHSNLSNVHPLPTPICQCPPSASLQCPPSASLQCLPSASFKSVLSMHPLPHSNLSHVYPLPHSNLSYWQKKRQKNKHFLIVIRNTMIQITNYIQEDLIHCT